MRGWTPFLLALGGGILLLSALLTAPVAAAGLQPPPGFALAVDRTDKEPRACPAPTRPFTGKLEFPSKYEGSDKSRDKLNPRAYKRYKDMIEPINDMEKEISAQVNAFLRGGQPQTLRCVLDWMTHWADAHALMDRTDNHTGKSVRKWALASLASAYLRLKFSSSRPLDGHADEADRIEAWFAELSGQVVADWKNQPLEKINNHEYWAAWAVMASAVALDRRDLFDWSVAQYRIAAGQVDGDGYLPNELRRDTRALSYHNYALGPLSMIAAFAQANGVDLRSEGNHALSRLAQRVLLGVDDPRIFKQRTGDAQNVEELQENSKFAWMEPYCWLYRCEGELGERVAALRPMKTYRLGGNLTEIFAPEQKGKRSSLGGMPPEPAARRASFNIEGEPQAWTRAGNS